MPSSLPSVLIISANSERGTRLSQLLIEAFACQMARTLNEAARSLTTPPRLIILDPLIAGDVETFIDDVQRHHATVCLVIVAASVTLPEKIRFLQSGVMEVYIEPLPEHSFLVRMKLVLRVHALKGDLEV